MNWPHRILLCALAALLPLVLSSCYGPCGPTWSSTRPSQTADTVLPASQYDAAETVYRAVLPGGRLPQATTSYVYCLSFGGSSKALPADFMARFANDTAVRTGDKGIVMTPGKVYQPAPDKDYVVQPGREYEVSTDRDVVHVTFYWVKFKNDSARAQLNFSRTSENITEIITLSKEHGEWTITGMNEIMRTNF